MVDVAVYGHLIKDTIFEPVRQPTMSLGGIANIWKPLVKSGLSVSLHPLRYGEALIWIERKSQQKFVKATLNQTKVDCDFPSQALWHHIAYINELDDVGFLSNLEGFISADTCCGCGIDTNSLSRLNLLFSSSDEMCLSPSKLLKYMPEGAYVLLHNNGGCKLYSKKEMKEFPINTCHEPMNILGAGDIFAAYVIASMVGGFTIEESIQLSQDKTLKELSI